MPDFPDADQSSQHSPKVSRRYTWVILSAVEQDTETTPERQGTCDLVILKPHPEAAVVLLSSNMQAYEEIQVRRCATLLLPKICKEFDLNPQITFWYCAKLYPDREVEYSQIHLYLDAHGAVHAYFSRVDRSRICKLLGEFGY